MCIEFYINSSTPVVEKQLKRELVSQILLLRNRVSPLYLCHSSFVKFQVVSLEYEIYKVQ